jgi:hypothetical protein
MPGRVSIAVWLICTLAGGNLFFPASAGAYVPPASELLYLMRQALGSTEALAVDQRVTVFQAAAPEGNDVLERLTYRFPDRLHSEIQTGTVKRTYVVSGNRYLTVIDGRVVSEKQGRYDLYTDILLYDLDTLLERRLAALGLNTEVASLGRLEGRLVYVVGARYPDTAGCQLWLDKNTLRPVRWLVAPPGESWGDGRLDIRYSLWQPAGNVWYPRQIRFYQDGKWFRQIDVEHVEAVRGLQDDLFDIDALKRACTATDSGDNSPPPFSVKIGEAIENFHRLYADPEPVKQTDR